MRRIVLIVTLIISTLSYTLNNYSIANAGAIADIATTPQSADEAIAIYQSLLDLTYPFTVMCVAAHPDDEDREALAFYRMKYGARTVIVTSTRGEGGQNSQGPELYEELGVVRTKEVAAMAQHLNAVTFNLSLP